MQLVIELPPREEQLAFNRDRWDEVCRDPEFRDTLHRVETNAFGKIIMSPPPAWPHSDRTNRIQFKLQSLIGGKALPECPVSTIGGVRAPDIAWYSHQRIALLKEPRLPELAPEICVEVLSPDNSKAEMKEKRHLYFEAGALEFWTCDMQDRMTFFHADDRDAERDSSALCPDFPRSI